MSVLPDSPPPGRPRMSRPVLAAAAVLAAVAVVAAAVLLLRDSGGSEAASGASVPEASIPGVGTASGTPSPSASGSAAGSASQSASQSAGSGTSDGPTEEGSGGVVVDPGSVPTAPPTGSKAAPLDRLELQLLFGPDKVQPASQAYYVTVGAPVVVRFAAVGDYPGYTLVERGVAGDNTGPIGQGGQYLVRMTKAGEQSWRVRDTDENVFRVVAVG